MNRKGEMRRATVLFLVLLICYAYFLPRWAEWNQNSRMDLTMAIVEQGTFIIDDYYENTGDYAVYGGHVYTDKAPGTSFVGVPAYAVFRALARLPVVERLLERASRSSAFQATLQERGTGLLEEKVRFAAALYFVTSLSIAVPSALLGGLMYRFLGHILPSPGLRWLLVLAYGLGTIAWPYSTVLYGHQLAAVLLFAAFYLAWRVRRGTLNASALWGIGALLGLAVLVEFPALPAAAFLTLYTLLPAPLRPAPLRPTSLLPRSIAPLLLAALPFALLLAYYNATCFGSPFASGYRYLANFPEISGYGLLGFGPPRWEPLWGITFSPYRGLFYLSPFLLLALPGFVAWVKEREWRAEGVLAAAFAGVQFLLISCWYDWRGGFAIGPRNLLLVLPYLVVAVAFFLRRWGGKGRLAFGGLVLLSLGMTGVAATAGQSFPPITIANPWTAYWWPRFIVGDVTRNLGMAAGLPGLWSLLPLPTTVGVGTLLARRWG